MTLSRVSYPAWCRCHEDYRKRNLLDPACWHDDMEDVEALLDALDEELGPEVAGSPKVRQAYNYVAAFIRPELSSGQL